jgi:hypothetical protein
VTSFSRQSASLFRATPSTALVLGSGAGAIRVSRRRRRLRRALLIGGGLFVAALLAAQALLPAIAEHQVRSALGPQATGVHVDIRATPAVKLLWHRADSVTVHVDRLTPTGSSDGSIGRMLTGLRVAPKLDLRVHELRARGVRLRDVSVHKDGALVVGRAAVNLRSLESSLPLGLRIRPLAESSDGISLEGTISPLGRRISARAVLTADAGRIVVRPEGIPLASLVTVPVFSDDRISVDGLSVRPRGDRFALTARAHLRDA